MGGFAGSASAEIAAPLDLVYATVSDIAGYVDGQPGPADLVQRMCRGDQHLHRETKCMPRPAGRRRRLVRRRCCSPQADFCNAWWARW